ncbi:MAG: tetratricopeptide repeat protein, partial [Treponema sp.]|nr:tetratricopeptide repeat protein [Treponema sp.]
MKSKLLVMSVCSVMALFGCAGVPPGGDLKSLDEALSEMVAVVEDRVPWGYQIAFTPIKTDADLSLAGDFLYEELIHRFSASGKLPVLARGQDVTALDMEHEFQMSGLVNDKAVVGFGHYLGAAAVLTGSYEQFPGFHQVSLRVLEVETSRVLVTSRQRIRKNDPVLANFIKPPQKGKAPALADPGLEPFNRGKALFEQGRYAEAQEEFSKALALNPALQDAYYYRGRGYFENEDYDRAVADFTQALGIDPHFAGAYLYRGLAYYYNDDDRAEEDFDRAIVEYTGTLRRDPHNADAYYYRGLAYDYNDDDNDRAEKDFDRAIAEYTGALGRDPHNAQAYYYRGLVYYEKGDYDRAIPDFTEALG